ncbi:MAG: intradiol ring-cleavage dioxygenase [Ilumatobacteraceae bacterium]
MSTHTDHDHDDDDLGHTTLIGDLSTIVSRRRMIAGALGASAAVLAGCAYLPKTGGSSSSATTSTSSTTSTTANTSPTGGGGATAPSGGSTPTGGGSAPTSGGTTTTDADTGLSTVPQETAGPYPADGSNGVNVLTESGIVRSNIRTSFGSSTTDAGGVPTTVTLTVIDVATGQPVEGAAIYLWHCDHNGNYSLYSQAITNENYLRGVQVTDANGQLTFLSYYPACYSGRWPHIHYEVYPSVDSITDASNAVATSQMAMPDATNQLVFATSLYSASNANYSQVSLATDNVFSDGTTNENPTITGDIASGLVITMDVPVSI